MNPTNLLPYIRDVVDFPKKGIVFKDLSPLLAHPTSFQAVIDSLAKKLPISTNKIVCIESRGFLFGAALAYQKGLPLVLARKPGKLPLETYKASYNLEYGQDTLEIHKCSLLPDDQVVILDDVLATGGTLECVKKLCEKTQAQVLSAFVVIELEGLKGRDKLEPLSVFSLLKF